MNELFAAKYDNLLTEFNRYIIENPQFLARLPNRALIILLDKRDPKFCAYAMKRMRRYLKNDASQAAQLLILTWANSRPSNRASSNPESCGKRRNLPGHRLTPPPPRSPSHPPPGKL